MSDLTDNENLSGTGQAHVQLTGQGKTSNEVMRSLNGELGLTLDEGALEGINIWYEIRRAYAVYKGLDAPEPEADRTVFSRIQFDAAVSEGLLTTRKLVADLPFLAVRGNGSVDLGKSNIDLQLTATVRDVPELSQDDIGSELKGKQLPFKVSGAMEDPKISIDWAKLMQGEAADMLLDKLGLGSDSESDKPNDETESTKDQNKEMAKGLLFDLLGGKKDKDDDG
jgi:AsmA protein